MPEYLSKRFGGQRLRIYFACLTLVLYTFIKCSVSVFVSLVHLFFAFQTCCSRVLALYLFFTFLVNTSDIWNCVIIRWDGHCPSVRPFVVLRSKICNVEHYIKTFHPNSFMHAMLIGAISFYHFISHSVTLPLARGHKVSKKQNLLASFSAEWDEYFRMTMQQLKVTIPRQLWSEIL